MSQPAASTQSGFKAIAPAWVHGFSLYLSSSKMLPILPNPTIAFLIFFIAYINGNAGRSPGLFDNNLIQIHEKGYEEIF